MAYHIQFKLPECFKNEELDSKYVLTYILVKTSELKQNTERLFTRSAAVKVKYSRKAA